MGPRLGRYRYNTSNNWKDMEPTDIVDLVERRRDGAVKAIPLGFQPQWCEVTSVWRFADSYSEEFVKFTNKDTKAEYPVVGLFRAAQDRSATIHVMCDDLCWLWGHL